MRFLLRACAPIPFALLASLAAAGPQYQIVDLGVAPGFASGS